ncbi:FprA family A-type flavoprotein [Candidatus Altiarchaeota archaeon]
MAFGKIGEDVYSVGAIDWDRRLFDELIPLPDGTSYNAYIVRGSEKTALIDTVDPTKTSELLKNLAGLDLPSIDYLIVNHAEQDHSGSIPDILEKYPGIKVVTNAKCAEFIKDLLEIQEDRITTVQDRQTLSLGDKTLEFIITPWVHWPETMITYLREDRILFSCDLFGSHLASSDLIAKKDAKMLESAKRYYAEIMMPFRKMIGGHLEKIGELEVETIAASHGPIYDDPGFIIDAYKEWISDTVKNQVIIAYVSMHDSTRKMVEHLTEKLIKKGVDVKPYNLTSTDVGDLAMATIDAATIILATPTVLAGPHPTALYAAYLLKILRPKTKCMGVIGSYGWGGRTVEILKDVLDGLNADFLEPILIKGYPGESELALIDGFADKIVEKHGEYGLMG